MRLIVSRKQIFDLWPGNNRFCGSLIYQKVTPERIGDLDD